MFGGVSVTKRATIYLDADLHRAVRMKAAEIEKSVSELSRDPRPPGCEKLSWQDRYRLRQGNYRILHEIQDLALIVVVVKAAHRRDVYRELSAERHE